MAEWKERISNAASDAETREQDREAAYKAAQSDRASEYVKNLQVYDTIVMPVLTEAAPIFNSGGRKASVVESPLISQAQMEGKFSSALVVELNDQWARERNVVSFVVSKSSEGIGLRRTSGSGDTSVKIPEQGITREFFEELVAIAAEDFFKRPS